MADKQFTFFELHFHDDIQLGPRSLGSGSSSEGDSDESTTIPELSSDGSTTDETEESGSGASVLAPLFALGLLVAAGYSVKRLLAGESAGGLNALDDIEADAEETAEELQDEAEDAVPIEITSPEKEEGGGIAVDVAAAVVLLLVLGAVARKLLAGSEEIVVEE
ncbi:hypothetical protein [Halolamina salifodinae]|uniref:Uncharacterized protein n=1 Tax=Halolamina salifodinae TaxID=1202767 RepID=A0A8T4GXW1_9EURY|nr:hypothetical protein [Halolamina salifodinae]MBP1987819.1 hypothetical protein [Halolamina salifodinae]